MLARKLHQTINRVGQVVKIPGMVLISCLIRMNDLLAFPPEAGAERRGGNISCILNLQKWLYLLVNHLPVFILNIVKVTRVSFYLCILNLIRKHLKLFERHALFVLVKGSRLG